MIHGKDTGEFGKALAEKLKAHASFHNHEVFYDHALAAGNPNVVATKGFVGNVVSNANRLTDIDIMVVGPDDKIRFLIEIEERDASPKKFLGDVLAVLLCNCYAVRMKDGKQRNCFISDETELIVAGIVPTNGDRLNKIKEVIQPRLALLSGLDDGLSPQKVTLLFSGDIKTTVNELDALITSKLS